MAAAVLDQYTLSLQGMASKLIEKSLGASDFPVAEVAAGALGWRLWGCGGPRWIPYCYIRLAGSGLAELRFCLGQIRIYFVLLAFNDSLLAPNHDCQRVNPLGLP